MKNVFTIIKKDLKRYFTDKRILIGLFLPGVVVFVMYSFMGSFITDAFTPTDDTAYTVYVQNAPEELATLISPDGMNVTVIATDGASDGQIKKDISDGLISAYLVFSENFIQSLGSTETPQIKIFYSSADTNSANIYSYYSSAFDAFEDAHANLFDVNGGEEIYDCATEEDYTTTFVTMLLPMLLMVFLWSGCMMVSTESIASEKERGTMATLLITPVKRANLAIGKVLSLSITALVSATSSFLGVILSLPSLFEGMNISLDVYNLGTYVALFAVIIFTVLLFTIILLIISTYAKSVKEATSIASTSMILVMLTGVSSMLGTIEKPLLYLVPIFNSAQCFTAILSLSFNPVNFLIAICSNALFIGLGVWLLTKMFNSERVMFHK